MSTRSVISQVSPVVNQNYRFDEGRFREDIDPDQIAFEFWGILQAFNHFARLFHHEDAHAWADAAFKALVGSEAGE